MNITPILISLFGPFFVWPIERFLPYPYIVEEAFKALIVLLTINNVPRKEGVRLFIISGLLFALTETFFYGININLSGRLDLLFIRLGTSGLLHSLTFLIIYLFGRKNKGLIPLGFILTTLIHYLYNLYI